jgi:D-amino peptidase
MRVYVSVDLEGIAGIGHPLPTRRGDDGYPAAVLLMTGETNAAIDGAFRAGATEVLVNDSHGGMYNLPPGDIDRRARLLEGQKVWSMVAGAGPLGTGESPRFDVALFVGYHARAGHPRGTLAHTYTGQPVETRLNGTLTGEYGINAAVLGAWGVPIGLVAGDDALATDVEAMLPWAERVVVKAAHGTNAAASVHPEVAADLIREAAARAIGQAAAGQLRRYEVESPVVIEVEYRRGIEADAAALVPGNTRFGDRGVRTEAPDASTAYRGFLSGVRLASVID